MGSTVMNPKQQQAILLVDDESSILKAINRLLRTEGYIIKIATSGAEGLKSIQSSDVPVALIISDQRMPQMNGTQFLEQAKRLAPDAIRFLLTGYSDMAAVVEAVNKGEIHRYLTKPWNDDELLQAVRQALDHGRLIFENRRLLELTQHHNADLNELNRELENKVRERTIEIQQKHDQLVGLNARLEQSLMDTIRFMSSLIETLNPRLGAYMRRTSEQAKRVAEEMGLAGENLKQVEIAGLIHDVGLIGVPDRYWEKEDKDLIKSEDRQFKNHPLIASFLLETIDRLTEVAPIVRHHHENVDGTGFPDKLLADDIPIGSKIIAVVGDYFRILSGWKAEKSYVLSRARTCFGLTAKQLSSSVPEEMIHEVAVKSLLLNVNTKYDFRVITVFLKTIKRPDGTECANAPVDANVAIHRLCEGMVLSSDLRLTDGRLLLASGTKLRMESIQSIRRLHSHQLIHDKVSVC
jgi:response regulator RpfG family c-di-GMP phosphodiesterase